MGRGRERGRGGGEGVMVMMVRGGRDGGIITIVIIHENGSTREIARGGDQGTGKFVGTGIEMIGTVSGVLPGDGVEIAIGSEAILEIEIENGGTSTGDSNSERSKPVIYHIGHQDGL